MSNDYFTDRQDRYVLIKDCSKLANYFEELVDSISDFSLSLSIEKDSIEMSFEPKPKFKGGHPYLGNFQTFVQEANSKITSFLCRQFEENRLTSDFSVDRGKKEDTWIFPSIQMGQLMVTQDSEITCKLLEQMTGEPGSRLLLGTGYFNLTDEYMQKMLRTESKSEIDVVMAHPKANSFYNAPFPLYGIPFAYTNIAKKFYDTGRVNMYEYQRPNWTFHCKGVWYFDTNSTLPFATMIGSPNFGYRSVEKDLEAQLTIITKNQGLQSALNDEQQKMFDSSFKVTGETFQKPDRLVPMWVKAVTGVARRFF